MPMAIDRIPDARYGRPALWIFAGFNVLLLVGACGGSWILADSANHRGISPNTTTGFRSQHTLASLHGWYVAQRVGFRFAAVATTIILVIVVAVIVVALIRHLNPLWIVVAPIIGGLAVGLSVLAAGQRADRAATAVENSAAARSIGESGTGDRLISGSGSAMTAVKKVRCRTSEPCLH